MVDKKTEKPITKEVAGISSAYDVGSYHGLLDNPDDTLASRGGYDGIKIYDDITKDAHIKGVLAKRKLAPSSYPWKIVPAGDSPKDKEIAKFIEEQIKNLDFDHLIKSMQGAVLKGYSVAEVMWGYEDGKNIIEEIKSRSQGRFKFNKDWELCLLKGAGIDFDVMPGRKFIVHRYGNEDNDNPYGGGLGRELFWPAFFKRHAIKFWMVFADKFGTPTIKVTYKSNGAEEENEKLRQHLKRAVSNIANDSAVIVPEGVEMELLGAIKSGATTTYESLVSYMDKQATIVILGETLTTDIGDAGSKAASQTHNDVRLEVVRSDCNAMASTLNKTIIPWLVEYNFGDAKAPKIKWDVKEQEDLNQRAERDVKLYDMGFEPDQEYIESHYGKGWEKRDISGVAKNDSGNSASKTEFAAADNDFEGDEITDVITQLDNATAPVIDGWIEHLKALLDGSVDLEDYREKVNEAYGQLSIEQLAPIMAQAMALADLRGRSDVSDGE